jgi:hypothetical protein
MTWFLTDYDKYEHAIKELPKQRDRGAAIVATAILEDALMITILSRLHRNTIAEKKLFEGPLLDFSGRIDLGVLLGLYPNEIQRHMHIIRTIRNRFAHRMEVSTFASQRGDCEKLKFSPGSNRAANKLLSQIDSPHLPPGLKITTFKATKNPRQQFIESVKAITMLLTLRAHFGLEEPPRSSPEKPR